VRSSSGIQILPAIKKQVKELVTFIREATWVTPPIGAEYRAYSPEERERFERDPQYHLDERRKIEASMNSSFAIFHADSPEQHHVRAYMQDQMESKLKDKPLEKVLIPEWSVGCRRLTPGTNYLESLHDDNVKVVFGEITHITETSVVCDNGSVNPVDILICATGFDTTFKPRFPLVGSTGEQLSALWKGMSSRCKTFSKLTLLFRRTKGISWSCC
jgi:cation diffusion facilitator CzcD-associated flavoprotein CzcO